MADEGLVFDIDFTDYDRGNPKDYSDPEADAFSTSSPVNTYEEVRETELHDQRVNREFNRLRAIEEAKHQLAEIQASKEPKLVLTSAKERRERPPIEWMVEGLAPVGGGVGIVFGRQGACKTWLVLDLALSVVNGRDSWMGRRNTGKGQVLYVLGEGTLGFPARESAWIEHFGGTNEGLTTIEGQNASLSTDEGLRRLLESIREADLQPKLIVFDTQGLTAGMGADENSRTEMRGVYSRAKKLGAELGCLVLMITHPGNDFTTGARPAGSSTQGQDADLILDVRWSNPRRQGTVWVRKVKEAESGMGWHFRKLPVASELVMLYDGPAGEATEDQEEGCTIEEYRAVYDAMAATGEEGISGRGLREGLGLHPDQLTRRIQWLLDGELVEKFAGPRRAMLHRVIAPFPSES